MQHCTACLTHNDVSCCCVPLAGGAQAAGGRKRMVEGPGGSRGSDRCECMLNVWCFQSCAWLSMTTSMDTRRTLRGSVSSGNMLQAEYASACCACASSCYNMHGKDANCHQLTDCFAGMHKAQASDILLYGLIEPSIFRCAMRVHAQMHRLSFPFCHNCSWHLPNCLHTPWMPMCGHEASPRVHVCLALCHHEELEAAAHLCMTEGGWWMV